jgi:hypothetical protein
MPKPKSQRQKDVISKFSYVNSRFQKLMNELFTAKKESRDPSNLVHVASEILATTRECFDYLGQDIVDSYIVPLTTKSKIKSDYTSGKLRAYFPFHEGQLTKSNALFHELQQIAPNLYTDLLDFTKSISNKKKIPKTLFEYELFLELKDMVNEKKHDKLIAIASEVDQEYLIENDSTKMIIPRKKQKGWKTFTVSPGTEVSPGSEYRFEFNYREVMKFCLFAHKATEIVILKLYDDYFE